jgi:hypothetical protein
VKNRKDTRKNYTVELELQKTPGNPYTPGSGEDGVKQCGFEDLGVNGRNFAPKRDSVHVSARSWFHHPSRRLEDPEAPQLVFDSHVLKSAQPPDKIVA